MFQDWYEEKEWYHLVGYWIAAHELESKKIDVNELLYALSDVYQTKTKTEFTVRLKKQILKNLLGGKNGLDDATLEDLTYGTLKEEFFAFNAQNRIWIKRSKPHKNGINI